MLLGVLFFVAGVSPQVNSCPSAATDSAQYTKTGPHLDLTSSRDNLDWLLRGQVGVHDFQATILHQLGLDHERLTYRHAGRDYRLTDVHGRVIKEILA